LGALDDFIKSQFPDIINSNELKSELGYGGYFGNDKIVALTLSQVFSEVPYDVYIYEDALKYFVFVSEKIITDYIFKKPGMNSIIMINHAGRYAY
jgi:hypothetical protein